MSNKKEDHRNDDELPELAMPDLTPEQALKGFMAVDPERVKEREACTCSEWPYKGGQPHPTLPGVVRSGELDREAVEPSCPVHGELVQEDTDG